MKVKDGVHYRRRAGKRHGWVATVFGGPGGRRAASHVTRTRPEALAWRDERLAEGWLAEPLDEDGGR